MTRSARLIAFVLLAALLLAQAGCISQTADANQAIQAANAQAEKYSALDGEISTLMDEAGAVDFTPEGAAAGIAKIDQAAAKFQERLTVIAGIKAEFAKIGDMNVDQPIKDYAAMQVEIADLLAQMDELGLSMLGDTKTLYELIAAGSTDTKKADELSVKVEEASAKMDALDKQITQKQAEADAFFETNGLGGK